MSDGFRLETARLTMREMVDTDLDFVASMLGDPQLMQYYPQPLDRAGCAAWLKRQRQRYRYHGYGLWLVEDRSTGQPVGQVGLLLQDVENQFEPEIGYLIHRSYWRHGFAFEAAQATMQFARDRYGYRNLISLIHPENQPSQGVARKLGGVFERNVRFKDHDCRLYRYP